MHSKAVATCRNLSHRYQNHAALDDINLDLQPGEITVLLGPNGAGKTTLIHLLLGLVQVQQGTITVLGQAAGRREARQHTGVMLQISGVQDNLTVFELLQLFVSLYPRAMELDRLLAETDLQSLHNRRFGQLSGGQQQRVLFAIALCGNPQLLILDEPTTGMDPAVRRQIWSSLEQRRKRGTAILLCTHDMHEAEQLADRIVLLNHGRVITHDTAEQIRRRLPSQLIKVRSSIQLTSIAASDNVQSISRTDDLLTIYCHFAEPVVRAILNADPDASELEVTGTDLETAFLALTKANPSTVEAKHE